jgi:lambda repressor-like predicted transcriptional regulator
MSSTSIENAMASISTSSDAVLKASALQAASPIVLALEECDEDLRNEAITLFKQLCSGELDEGERYSTLALLAEILFPNADDKGLPGLDLEEAEGIAQKIKPEAKDVLMRMDQEEATFAERLREVMKEKGMTQERLAEMVGVGQSAISMMLQRSCRPQQRTIRRLAEALGVAPKELWPTIKEGK